MRLAGLFPCLWVLAATGCVATAGAHARTAETPPAAEGDVASLHFGWPEGFQARVTLVHREQRSDGRVATARATHRLVTERKGGAIRVLVREVEAEGDVPDLEANVQISEALVQVVSRDGAYLRTEGLEQALEILGAEDEATREVSRAALERISELDWELTAGAWTGRALAPGHPLSRQFSGSMPLLPGVPALLDVEQSLLGRAPCEEGAAAECVELSWRGVPVAAARAAALGKLRSEAGEGEHAIEVEGVDARVDARLVAEPGTLIPHRLDIAEELRITVRQPGGDAIELIDHSDDHYQFASEQEL
jgi:hypothetical protein